MVCDHAWFDKNPKKTIVIVSLLLFSLVDFLFAMHSLNDETRYRIRSDIYHHGLAPNKSITRAQWGPKFYSLNTNSLGFKDHIAKYINVNSKYYRILFIGDSFAEGVGVEYEKTFVGIIANELAKKDIEVLNASASSYSPIIYLTKIKYLIEYVGLKFDELIVFLDISDIQDEVKYYIFDENYHVIDNDAMVEKEEERGFDNCSHLGKERILDRYLRKVKKFTMLTRTVITIIENFFENPNPFFRQTSCSTNLRRAMWTLDNAMYEEYGMVGLEKSKEHLSSLLRLLKNHGIKLTLAVYPWPDQIINHDLHSRHVAFWQEWAIENNVNFLNYFPHFINERNREEILETYFIPGDIHWNATGHQLIARIFLNSYRPGE